MLARRCLLNKSHKQKEADRSGANRLRGEKGQQEGKEGGICHLSLELERCAAAP